MPNSEPEPQSRGGRLAAIAVEYTEEIHDSHTAAQLAGADEVARYAAVTSEGSAESSYASNGNLLVGETSAELADLLRQECGEGWVAHGRVWDLDAPFDIWGTSRSPTRSASARNTPDRSRRSRSRVARTASTCSTTCSMPRPS
jgi:hypothetical protein